ncbi:hypothetical protein FHETE_1170 [Fusarium heterosporum]|uniref:Nephrocystin 3-like N-terminal domain-containing protein n=1 Tax=Fusarium heterosporum TaxID=42747 RepID=A0A8H5X215_FUSHE|nr:hypothetical protein FHETE_1170 [Fusarium heterosporum]
MDPVTAVGLASAIISFVPLGVSLLKNAREIRDSVDGTLEKNETRKAILDEMQAVAGRLKPAIHTPVAPGQKGLYDLAFKCYNLSQKILELLAKIKPKPQSSFGAYRSAFRAWSKEDVIKDLEKTLDDCRSQLALGLVDLSNQNTTAYSQKLLAIAQNDSSKLDELQGYVRGLKKDLDVEKIGKEACDQLRRFLNLQEHALTTIYQQRILKSIRFDDIHQRHDRVHLPHKSTFNWLLEDDLITNTEGQTPVRDEVERKEAMKRASRRKFSGWLSSSEGVFHISGKLGSGKSTLMKLVSTHPQTRIQLQKWAGSNSLLMPRFFFWKPGSELQKSLDGLYRSLLHDILDARPDLIQQVLPEAWNKVASSPWQIQSKLDISNDVFKSALERCIFPTASENDLGEGIRLCFFIDGLDEYEEADGKDHVYLVRLLNDWAKRSYGRLKMVLSSRDYNVFLNGFPADQRLQLHELTWFDMVNYVRVSLEHLQNSGLKDYFLESIPEKANGIFLWIVLVVNEIRKKVEDDASEEQLLRLLESLPPGLEALFHHILNGLDTGSRRTAYQTMAVLRTAQENELPLSLLAFSYLDDYQKDPEFSIREGFMSLDGVLDEDRTPQKSCKRLRGTCGGLVEAHGTTNTIDQYSWTLGFTHRSIPEMLDRRYNNGDIELACVQLNAVDALSHLIFAAVQFTNDKKKARPLCGGVAWMRLVERTDKPPYRFLQIMNSWAGDAFGLIADPSQILVFQGSSFYADWGLHSLVRHGSLVSRGDFNMLSQAAILGHMEYVNWGFENDPDAVDEPWKRALIANVLLDNHMRGGPSLEKVEILFEDIFLRGEPTYFKTREFPDLFPQLKSPKEPLEEIPVGTDSPIDASSSYATSSYDLTIWQRHLVSCFLGWAGLRYPFHPDRFGIVVEQFLKHGAPSNFLVAIDDLETPKHITLHFDGTVRPLRMEMSEEFKTAVQHLVRGRRSSMSLREWIEIVNPKNRDSLVDLLEGSVQREGYSPNVLGSVTTLQDDPGRCNVTNEHSTQLPFRPFGRPIILYILLPCLMTLLGIPRDDVVLFAPILISRATSS